MNRVALVFVLVAGGCAGAAPKARMPEAKTMDEPTIVQAGDAVLRKRAEEVPVEKIKHAEFQALLARMTEEMRAAPGVGLAAPQIGVSMRVFVVEDRDEYVEKVSASEIAERERVPVPLRVFINPVVTPIGDEKVTFFEGCLSVDGWAGLVARHREVEVKALDENAQPVTWRVHGWPARILQHEMDHLDGTLYIDRMHTRSFATHASVKARFAGKPIAEILEAHDL